MQGDDVSALRWVNETKHGYRSFRWCWTARHSRPSYGWQPAYKLRRKVICHSHPSQAVCAWCVGDGPISTPARMNRRHTTPDYLYLKWPDWLSVRLTVCPTFMLNARHRRRTTKLVTITHPSWGPVRSLTRMGVEPRGRAEPKALRKPAWDTTWWDPVYSTSAWKTEWSDRSQCVHVYKN